MLLALAATLAGAVSLLWPVATTAAPGKTRFPLPVQKWQLVESESGPVNYYQIITSDKPARIRSQYKPPYETAVLGYKLSDHQSESAKELSWQWRALTLPKGGDECKDGKGDSAAVVYVTWRRGLRWYTLKYVWSPESPKGAVCDRRRNPFVAQDTIVLRSGGPLGKWQSERINLKHEFRKHFEDGDPNADVPDLLGVGLMTDGDQTQSKSAAEYANFMITG